MEISLVKENSVSSSTQSPFLTASLSRNTYTPSAMIFQQSDFSNDSDNNNATSTATATNTDTITITTSTSPTTSAASSTSASPIITTFSPSSPTYSNDSREFPCYSDDIVSPDTPSTTSLNPQYTTAPDSSDSVSKTTTKPHTSAQVPNISVPFPPDLDAQTLVSSLLNKKSGCIPTKAPNKFIIYRTEYKKALEAKGYRYKMKEISPSVGRAWRAEPQWVKDYYKRLWVQASKLLRDIQRQSPRYMDSTWISMNECVGMSYEKDTAKREDETRKEEDFSESANNVMTNEFNNHTTIHDQNNLYSPTHSLINTNAISATLLPDATLDSDYCIQLHGESNPHECDGAVRWVPYVVDDHNGNMCGMPGNFNTVSMFSPTLIVDENPMYMSFDAATYLNNSY